MRFENCRGRKVHQIEGKGTVLQEEREIHPARTKKETEALDKKKKRVARKI